MCPKAVGCCVVELVSRFYGIVDSVVVVERQSDDGAGIKLLSIFCNGHHHPCDAVHGCWM